jgi:hypothetical protein
MELMTAAFLMDLGLFFYGPVRSVVRCPRAGFAEFPFEGRLDGAIVRKIMAFYNQRLARIARKRQAAGVYGTMNLDSRTLLKGFEPNRHVWKLILRGARIWLRAELRSLSLFCSFRGLSGRSRLRWPFHPSEISFKRSTRRAS